MKLVFVYNAEEGFFSAILDTAHKLFRPSTYSCDLCKITHGYLGKEQDFRSFIKGLEIETDFYHRKDFRKTYPENEWELPFVGIEKNGTLNVIISAQELTKMDLNDLINRISSEIKD